MTSNPKAVKKYQETRDAIMIRPSLEEGEKIRKAAREIPGMSLQRYILAAIREKMDRDSTNSETIKKE